MPVVPPGEIRFHVRRTAGKGTQMPAERFVEERHQTQHKIEAMGRYFGAWCFILARAKGVPFCTSRLWLIDTHAGRGLHLSEGDPDGVVPGTPVLAVLAARNAQLQFPGVTVRVRATDIAKATAIELDAYVRRYRGKPPTGVDVRVGADDWVKFVAKITTEILEDSDHPHNGGRYGGGAHDHRSLWFVDPYGVEGIDHGVIEGLPRGSEVIVNLDLMGLLRDAARAENGEQPLADLLDRAFGGPSWRGAPVGADGRAYMIAAFEQSFARRYKHRNHRLLRPSGSQDRAMIHLADSDKAVPEFARAVQAGLEAGTVIARGKLTAQQRGAAVVQLHGMFGGVTLTAAEMRGAAGLSISQVRVACKAAEDRRYGRWDAASGTMEWFAERAPELTLWDSAGGGQP